MDKHEHEHTLFADAIAIAQWLERDRDLPYADRLSRDRKLAVDLPDDRIKRVREWWRRIRAEHQPNEEQAQAERADQVRSLVSILVVLVGVLSGVGLASAVFHYDGTWPVNVVTVFAAIVLVQVLLLVTTLLLMLPRLPGLTFFQRALASVNPGAIVAAIARRVSRADQSATRYLDWKRARGPSAARFARWQILTWSQMAAVAFNVAVLLTALTLVVFTDLAFGWSTTLRMETYHVVQLSKVVSAPWHGIWPDAVPTAQLIEHSRYYRLSSAPPAAAEASALTGWWPFLIAAIVTYGLIPRMVLLTFASSRLRAATSHLLLSDANVTALLDRLQAPEMTLGSPSIEQSNDASSRPLAPAPAAKPSALAVVWSAALPQAEVSGWAAAHLQWQVERVLEAGGGRPLAADQSVITQLKGASGAVLVFVRGWEAPLLDLADFLQSIRTHVAASCSLVIVPVGAQAEVVTDVQRTTWSRWASSVGDPALYVAEGL